MEILKEKEARLRTQLDEMATWKKTLEGAVGDLEGRLSESNKERDGQVCRGTSMSTVKAYTKSYDSVV